MPAVIQPRQLLGQPMGLTYIDWGKPVTEGLVSCVIPHLGINLVDGKRVDKKGAGVSIGAESVGKTARFSTSALSALRHTDNPYALDTFTAIALIKPRVYPADGASITTSSGEETTTTSALFRIGSDGKLQLVKPGSALIATANTAISTTKFSVVGVSYAPNASSAFYVDGRLDKTFSSSITFNHGAIAVIGGSFNSAGYGWDGDIACVLYFNRLLSNDTHAQIAANIYSCVKAD